MKGYKLWDLDAKKVLYRKSVIFHELKPSIVDLYPEKEEKKKKDVVKIQPTLSRVELCIPIGPDNGRALVA